MKDFRVLFDLYERVYIYIHSDFEVENSDEGMEQDWKGDVNSKIYDDHEEEE